MKVLLNSLYNYAKQQIITLFYKKGESDFMSKNKKRIVMVAGVFLLLAVTITVCYFIFSKNQDNKTDLKYDDNATTGFLPGTDINKKKEELQNMLDRSMIAFSINTSPVFLDGASEGNLLIENPGNNAKLLRISILMDGTNQEIYSSDYLKPGTYIESARLDKVLKKGTYDATAYFLAYEEETGEYIGQTGAQIAITVQN